MRGTRSNLQRHVLMASAFASALMLLPAASFADPDDHPGTTTQQKIDNARDKYQDQKQDIREDKHAAIDRTNDRYQDKKEDIHERMQGSSGDRREDLKEHLSNVKDREQDKKTSIREAAAHQKYRATDRFQDRKDTIKDKADDRDATKPNTIMKVTPNDHDTDDRPH